MIINSASRVEELRLEGLSSPSGSHLLYICSRLSPTLGLRQEPVHQGRSTMSEFFIPYTAGVHSRLPLHDSAAFQVVAFEAANAYSLRVIPYEAKIIRPSRGRIRVGALARSRNLERKVQHGLHLGNQADEE